MDAEAVVLVASCRDADNARAATGTTDPAVDALAIRRVAGEIREARDGLSMILRRLANLVRDGVIADG